MASIVLAVLLSVPIAYLLRQAERHVEARYRHEGEQPAPLAAGWWYGGIQLLAAIVPVSAAIAGAHGYGLWAGCLLGWALLALAWIDLRTLILPDALTLPLIVAGLLAAWLLAPEDQVDRAAGAIAGYGSLCCIALLYRRLRGQDGLGLGDAKLLAAGGAWTGWQALPMIVLAGALAGIAVAFARKIRGYEITASTALPFGPFLALAIWGAWLWNLHVR